MSVHHQDQAYFDRLKEQLNNFLHHQGSEFSERNIHELRDKLGRMMEEANQERSRDVNRYPQLQQQVNAFVADSINFILLVLQQVEPQVIKNIQFSIRSAAIEFLSKKTLLGHMNQNIVDNLTQVLENDNEINAIAAIRILNDVIKNAQQQPPQYQRQNQVFSDTTLLRLYNFFEKRIEFLVKFNSELKKSNCKSLLGDSHPNSFHDSNFLEGEERQTAIRLNKSSLSFVTQIPQFYIFTVVALDTVVKEETKNQMKEILKKALRTMYQAIHEANFEDLLAKVPRNIVQELYNTYSKFLQLFTLVLKREFEAQNQASSKLLRDLSEQIKLDSIVGITIKILKSCPIDLMHQKMDISNRLKQILQLKREVVQQNEINDKINEINQNVMEMIEEETIIGKIQKIPSNQKLHLYQNWLEIIKNVVQVYLPRQEQQQQQQQQQNLERMQSDFLNNQIYMEKIFNTIFKILFDQSLHLAVHDKALELIKIFLEQFATRQDKYFIDKVLMQYYIELTNTNQNNPMQTYPVDQMYKEITHSNKYKLLDRLFQMIGMKLQQIRKCLKNCKDMLIRQNKWGIIRKTTSQTNIASLPCNTDFLNEQFIQKLDTYICENQIDIDSNLITLQDQTATQVYTFDDEEEYQTNGMSISNYTQFVEYAKDVKYKIFDQLNEIMAKLLQFVVQTNKEIVAKCKCKQGPLYNATNENRQYPYLSNIQCHYMSKILKNGLMIFEELHDHQHNHFEIFEYKRKTIFTFMSTFVGISDPINFKNVFEPNAKLLLKISVGIYKTCPETHCIPTLLQEHIQQYPPDTSASKVSFKCYIEFLLTLFFKELQTTPEMPSKFGFIRNGQVIQNDTQKEQDENQQNEYISIIQKLIRLPIRLFPRIKQNQNEEPIVKNLIKQLILFFVKKSHETLYPIDYLGLLLSLVKRIPTPNFLVPEQTDTLTKYFYQLCDKYDRNDKQLKQFEIYHRINLSGVNIVLNMFELFSTGIVEIQDIVAEVIVNFPLQKNIQINLAKQYPIFAQCLYRALHNITLNDNQLILKTLLMLDTIIIHLSSDELRYFFGDLLQPFIEKLLSFPSEYKMTDILTKSQNFLQDPSFKAVKILSKLGELVRKVDWPLEIKRNHTDSLYKQNEYLEIQIEGFSSNLKLNITEIVRCSAEILQNVLENQLATYLFKQSSIQHSYQIIKLVLLKYYNFPISEYVIQNETYLNMKIIYNDIPIECDQFNYVIQDEELINQVTKVFIGLSNFHNIIQTLTTATFHKIKEDVENIVTTLSEMFFIQLADEHAEKAIAMNHLELDLQKQYELVQEGVQQHLQNRTPAIKWISHLFKGLNKRYMLTAEENMNFKDFYIQQHEFIWNKLLMGNCLKKYKKILQDKCEKSHWSFNVQYTIFCTLLEEFVYEKFLKQTQLQKEDDRARKIRIVQSFGGTMIPSEGLNNRSISIELLMEIQNQRPNFAEFIPTQITGLPYIPDRRVFECCFILLKQLPETIKVVPQVLTKALLFQTFRVLINNLNQQNTLPLLENSFVQGLFIVIENLNTYKLSLQTLCLEILDLIISDLFKGNAAQLMYLRQQTHDVSLIESYVSYIPVKEITSLWLEIPFKELLTHPRTEQTVIRKIVEIIHKLINSKSDNNDIDAQKWANGYRLLTYLLPKQGILQGKPYFLFKAVYFTEFTNLDESLDQYVQKAFSLIQTNEDTYAKHSKLIVIQETEQAGTQLGQINYNHYLDDLEYKINIENIDFEIRWQSYMIAALFGFLKCVATIPYVSQIQRNYQKNTDRSIQTEKPPILHIKYKTVELLYEGLIRVEQSIRQSAYKYLLELQQQEGYQNDKTLFENDERLKKVMKPLLTCVQSEILNYVPSFLKSLKLILKIFSKVFHKALSDKLQVHLVKIVSGDVLGGGNIQQLYCTAQEWQSNSQESLSFQMGIINGLLKLFQHLTTQLVSPSTHPNHSSNIVSKIINDTHQLKRNYVQKVSRLQLNIAIQKPLVKFLNTLAVSYFELFHIPVSAQQFQQQQKQLEQAISNTGQQGQLQTQNLKLFHDQLKEKLKYIKTIRQILSENSAFPLREKICREKSQLPQKLEKFNQFIIELSNSIEKGLLQISTLSNEAQQTFHSSFTQQMINVVSEIKVELTQFGYQQCKRNPVWLKKNTQFLEQCVLNNIQELIGKLKQPQKKMQLPIIQQAYNQLNLPVYQINALLNRYASILKQYIQQNEDSDQAITWMIRLLLYSSHDKVKKWILDVARNRSISLRRRIVEIWMDNFSYKEDEACNQIQMLAGYHIIYPILFYTNQRGDLNELAELSVYQKMKEINDELVKFYSKITQDIENNFPFNYLYKNQQRMSDINNYYKNGVIDMLQITSYLICFKEQQLPNELKIYFLQFGYDMIGKQDKLVTFYANLYFSKSLKKNGLIHNEPISVKNRYLKIYNRALKQLDESGPQELELYALCRKIISVVLPCLEEGENSEQKDWIQATQSLLKQDSSNLDPESAQKVSRFWSMFIRNHKIFHNHHEQFTIHIINSMQQIGLFQQQTNPQSQINHNYQNYRRIALDMAFLQVEWKTKQIQKELQNGQNAKQKFYNSFHQTEASTHDESLSSEIYQSFFIKQSLRAYQPEESELQKRALYLLKKILIIAPLTNYKLSMETVKKNIASILNQLNDFHTTIQPGRGNQPQQTTPYFRYFMVVLHVLIIILEFQPLHKIVNLFTPYYDIILNMSQLPEQLQIQNQRNQQQQRTQPLPQRATMQPVTQPSRGATLQDRQQLHTQLLNSDHVQLVFSSYTIFKKLLKAAKLLQSEQSEQFQQALFDWCKDIINNHPQFKKTPPNNHIHAQYIMGQPTRNQQPPQQVIRVNMLSIFILKVFFDYDTMIIKNLIPALKRVAETLIEYLKQKDKGEQYLDNIKKHSNQKIPFNIRAMELEQQSKSYSNSDLSSFMQDFMGLKEDFPFGLKGNDQLYFNEDFPEQQKMKFHLYRSALQKILKMIAYNFDEMKDNKDQMEFLQLLLQIIEQVTDYELKLECIAILRMLFLNFKDIPNKEIKQEAFLQEIALNFSPTRAEQIKREYQQMESNDKFKSSKLQYETVLIFFFDLHKFQNLLDKKIDQRSSDSFDNQHQKIQDLKVFKVYFMFLCEYLMIKPYKSQGSGFQSLKNSLEKGNNGALKEFRKILNVISKLSTCLQYLTYFYKKVLDLFGYSYERFMMFLLGDPVPKSGKDSHTEGEEIMLMALKFQLLGRGRIIEIPQYVNKYVRIDVNQDKSDDAKMREGVLQKYLGIYSRKQKLTTKRLFDACINLITSEYLPSIVIYNLSYIQIQDIPQQPLRECIIPSAALELMGTASNVSSRLLRPLFQQILTNLCGDSDIGRFSQLLDYLANQPTSNGTQTTVAQFLVNYCLKLMNEDGIMCLLENQQMAQGFNKLIKCLIQKNHLGLVQNLLEEFFNYLNTDCTLVTPLTEDIYIQLKEVYQKQCNNSLLFGTKHMEATQPWVKQLLMMGALREPAQQQILLEMHQNSQESFWEEMETEKISYSVQKQIDSTLIQQCYVESLQQLNQWQTLKQLDNLSKYQQHQLKIDIGLREKSAIDCNQGWKDLSELKFVQQQQNDYYCYIQAFFKLYDFIKDDTSSNHQQRTSQQIFPQIEQNLKFAQIINCYNFIDQLPKLTLSYEQIMASPLLWGSKFLTFVEQFQLYTELEEIIKQYITQSFTSQNPLEQLLDSIQNTYNNSIFQKKFFNERLPLEYDSHTFTQDLMASRQIQMILGFQRFSTQLSQFLTSQAQQSQIDQRQYFLAFLDYKTLLHPMRYHYKQGILDQFDESTIIKEIPQSLQLIAEKLYTLERIKYKTKMIQDVDQNLVTLLELQKFVTEFQTAIPSSEDNKNYLLGRILRLKIVNSYYKLLRIDSDMQIEERQEKLESQVLWVSDFFIKQQMNHFKFWKDVQQIYIIALKRFNNNLSYAHSYIQISPLAVQYKPEKYPLQLVNVFNIINLTNPNDSLVEESFCNMIPLIPNYILSKYIPQLISTYMKNSQEKTKKCCLDSLIKLANYNKLLYYQLLQFKYSNDPKLKELMQIIPENNEINNVFSQIYAQEDIYEEILYISSKILDNITFELGNEDNKQKYIKIINLIQRNQNIKDKITKKYGDIIKPLHSAAKSQEIFKLVSVIYEWVSSEISTQFFDGEFNYTNLYGIKKNQFISISQLYQINEQFKESNLIMFGVDTLLKKQNIHENIYIQSLFATITNKFTKRKRIIRLFNLLGNNEKKYQFQLKKSEIKKKNISQILSTYFGHQFVKIADQMCQNYKETQARNVSCYIPTTYSFEKDKFIFTIQPNQEENQNLADILDITLTQNVTNQLIPQYAHFKMDVEQFIPKDSLQKMFFKFCKTADSYIQMRKILLTNISVQFALSFTQASSSQPKQLENLIINFSDGKFYQQKFQFQEKLYDPMAIRYSRNMQALIGEINLNAIIYPTFTATILAILNYENGGNLVEYITLLFWQLGYKESPDNFIKKLKDIVYEGDLIDSKCDRLIQYSQQLFEEKQKNYVRRWF